MIAKLENGHLVTIEEDCSSLDEQDVKETHSGQVFFETDRTGAQYIFGEHQCHDIDNLDTLECKACN